MSVLIKPVISEKMTRLGEKHRQYGFLVDPTANKLQIKKAVEAMYGVMVDAVNTQVRRGKSTVRGTRNGFTRGVKGHGKRAVVTLKEGDAIDFYSSI